MQALSRGGEAGKVGEETPQLTYCLTITMLLLAGRPECLLGFSSRSAGRGPAFMLSS